MTCASLDLQRLPVHAENDGSEGIMNIYSVGLKSKNRKAVKLYTQSELASIGVDLVTGG